MKTSLKEIMGAVSYELLQYNASCENITNEISKLEEQINDFKPWYK